MDSIRLTIRSYWLAAPAFVMMRPASKATSFRG
jgi:hypothetical protein